MASEAPVALGQSPEQVTLNTTQGCGVVIRCSSIVEYDGKRVCVGQGTHTGVLGQPGQLGVTATPQQIQNANQLKAGQCPGEVNGVQVVVPCQTVTQTEASTSTTTNPDGSTSQSKTATTCTGDRCTTTTTTTTTNATGQTSTTQSSTTTGIQSFCQQSPDHPSCAANGIASSFEGSCSEGFTCKEGDAIQCATARVLHEQQCAMTPTTSALDAYVNAMQNPDVPNPNNSVLNVTTSMFSTASPIGSGSCSLDKNIVVWGHTVSLPFSQVCTVLGYMGTLLQAIGFLLAFRIVSRG